MNKDKKEPSPLRRGFMFGIGAGISMAIIFLIVAAIFKMTCNQSDSAKLSDPTQPNSHWLSMRDTLDDGFSRGWLPHFMPSEDYWTDMHIHLRNISGMDELEQALDQWFSKSSAYGLRKIVVITGQVSMFEVFGELSKKDPRFAWIYRPSMNDMSVAQVREAVRHGACALKLHNASIMAGRTPRHIWQNDDWQAIFAYLESVGIPILWHVTQRHGFSPYHGGGLNSYWSDGWEKGIDFTNEDLLQDVLALMRRYPKLKVIGAHQLHVGLDRLNELLKAYENLYIDSSCGMTLRWADEFIEKDRLALREFVETWSERIAFGTDLSLSTGGMNEYSMLTFLSHARFILTLRLDDKALQDVAWRTSQQLFNLKPEKVRP
jgi:predicted TIM-barrel fold metal-dependent hydrolase